MPHWMADATHAFDERRVSVDMRLMDGNVATKALISKDVDLLLQGAAALITADLNGNADLALVASELNHSTSELNVLSSIRIASDLKGKLVGSDRPGTAVDYQTRLLLNQLGLKPTDVEARPLGGSDVQFAALIAGQLQAATLSPPTSFQAEAQGYHPLADAYKVPYQGNCVVVARSRIDELAPAIVAFLEGCREGIRSYNSQPDLALKVLQQYTKETNPAVLQKTYEFYKTVTPFQEDLQPTLEGLKSMLDFLGDTSIPAAKNAKAEQFIDTRLLSQLAKT